MRQLKLGDATGQIHVGQPPFSFGQRRRNGCGGFRLARSEHDAPAAREHDGIKAQQSVAISGEHRLAFLEHAVRQPTDRGPREVCFEIGSPGQSRRVWFRAGPQFQTFRFEQVRRGTFLRADGRQGGALHPTARLRVEDRQRGELLRLHGKQRWRHHIQRGREGAAIRFACADPDLPVVGQRERRWIRCRCREGNAQAGEQREQTAQEAGAVDDTGGAVS